MPWLHNTVFANLLCWAILYSQTISLVTSSSKMKFSDFYGSVILCNTAYFAYISSWQTMFGEYFPFSFLYRKLNEYKQWLLYNPMKISTFTSNDIKLGRLNRCFLFSFHQIRWKYFQVPWRIFESIFYWNVIFISRMMS